ncbi:MAG: GTPase HflX [Culicoidibacterales bacterium]
MKQEHVILVGVQTTQSDTQFAYSLEELTRLTTTADGQVVLVMTQKAERVNAKTYLGSGKLEELHQMVQELEADTVIFNTELSPTQVRNLQAVLSESCKVIDRTQLVLDIFAKRARTKEGRLQVELAQLEYLLPRLRGQGEQLSRLGGGIGTRGPGESKLETDRRHIVGKLEDIREELAKVQKHRDRQREQRKSGEHFQIALIGYTNAGKSTIFNQLSKGHSFAEDKLFATLDPLARQCVLPCGMVVILADTVGFIQDLPTRVIAAFRSTLEEAKAADLLLHIVDGANANYVGHEQTVEQLLAELEADQIPTLTVYNKNDCIPETFLPRQLHHLRMSAQDPSDIERLGLAIEARLCQLFEAYHFRLKPEQLDWHHRLQRQTILREFRYDEASNTYEVQGFMPPTGTFSAYVRELANQK